MKKTITIVVIILVVLGFGYFLFKISPQQDQASKDQFANYDLSQAKPGSLSAPEDLRADDHILGNPNAKNTLIAYEDYQCPYCAEASDMLNQAPTQLQDTKLVFRYYPLSQHRNSIGAAYAAEAAGAQGKYWEMHDQLFKDQNNWAELTDPMDEFVKLAQAAGVSNIDQFKSDITSGKFKDRVQENLIESLDLNLPGTPSFYFNGKPIQSTYQMDQLKAEVQSAGYIQ